MLTCANSSQHTINLHQTPLALLVQLIELSVKSCRCAFVQLCVTALPQTPQLDLREGRQWRHNAGASRGALAGKGCAPADEVGEVLYIHMHIFLSLVSIFPLYTSAFMINIAQNSVVCQIFGPLDDRLYYPRERIPYNANMAPDFHSTKRILKMGLSFGQVTAS